MAATKERIHRSAAIPSRHELFAKGGILALNGVELLVRRDEAGASVLFKRAKEAFELARTVTVFENAVHVAELDEPVTLLRPIRERQPKPPREKNIQDIGQKQLEVGRAYLEINQGGTDFAYPRPSDVALHVYPTGDVEGEEKEKGTKHAGVNASIAKRGLLTGLERIKDVPEEKIPPRLKELLDYARTKPKYDGYPVDDLILVIQRKKDFDGRVKPVKSAKRRLRKGRKEKDRSLRDLSEREEELARALFELNVQGNDFMYPTLHEATSSLPAYTDRFQAAEGDERTRLSKTIGVVGTQMSNNIVDKFQAIWSRSDAEAPPRIAVVIAWLSQQREYGGLTREGFFAIAKRKVKSLEQARQVGERKFIKEQPRPKRPRDEGARPPRLPIPERIDIKDLTAAEAGIVEALYAFNEWGTDYQYEGAYLMARALDLKTIKTRTPTLRVFDAQGHFFNLLRAVNVDVENGYDALPSRARKIVTDFLSREQSRGLTRDEIISVGDRKIDFRQMKRRLSAGLQEVKVEGNQGTLVVQSRSLDGKVRAPQTILTRVGARPIPPRDSSESADRVRKTAQLPSVREAATAATVFFAYPEELVKAGLAIFPQEIATDLIREMGENPGLEPSQLSAVADGLIAAVEGDNFNELLQSGSLAMRDLLNYVFDHRDQFPQIRQVFASVAESMQPRRAS